MATKVTLTLSGNGTVTQDVRGNKLAAYVEDIEWEGGRPMAGELLLEYKNFDDDWELFNSGRITYPDNDPNQPVVKGKLIKQVRLTVSGVTPEKAVDIVVYLTELTDSGIDEAVYDGTQGLTTQSFSEANSKNGNQFEFTTRITNLLNLTPQYIGFETGDFPVIVKQREVYGGFVDADLSIFEDADYSGGTVAEYTNNNALVSNDGGVTITVSPTVNAEGLLFGSKTPLLGSEGVGGRVITTFGGNAGEKILASNTKYLIKFENLATAAISTLALRLYWYEGFLSTQLRS